MAGKGKVKATKRQVRDAPYGVRGTTLQEIWDDISAKGPKSGSSPRAGYTKCPYKSPPRVQFDGETKESKKRTGQYEATIWIKAAELSMSCTIQYPALQSDRDLSKAAKQEWSRFMKQLRSHETEHVSTTEKELKAVASEMQALTGSGTGKDKKAAIAAAQKDLMKVVNKKYSSAKVQERLTKANKALDSKGGHGPTLKTSIP